MRPSSLGSILTILGALTLQAQLASADAPEEPPGYTVELKWAASDNPESIGVGTDSITAIMGDLLTLEVYLNVFDDEVANSLYSYNLSIEYDVSLLHASNYLPATTACTGEVCEEGTSWPTPSGGTVVLESVSPATAPMQDPENRNTIHYEDGVELGMVGSTDGSVEGPVCDDANQLGANARVHIATVDFTVLRNFSTSEVESVLRPGVGMLPSADGIFSTCIDEVVPEEIDFRVATIVPEPALATAQLAVLGCLALLRRRRYPS
jgi:hypothetical protein